MTLENIVPILADCKKIPQGCFADNALVWMISPYQSDKLIVIERWRYGAGEVYPAPTLAEILAELTTVGCVVRVSEVGGNVEYTASLPLSDIEETNTNPATAALRLLDRLKGVQG